MLANKVPSYERDSPHHYTVRQVVNKADLEQMLFVYAKEEEWLYTHHDIRMFLECGKVSGIYEAENQIVGSLFLSKYTVEGRRTPYAIGACNY
jgi:hypothetical protein